MTRSFKAALIGAVVVLVGASAAAQTSVSSPAVIVTQGEATIKAAPDRAWVTLGVEARAQTAEEAQRTGAEGVTAIHAMLKQFKFPPETIRTAGYNLQPEYDYVNGRQTFRAYVMRQTVEVRVDDVAMLSKLLGAAGSAGATQVHGLRWDLKDRREREREALRLSVQDAMNRAQAIAEGARKTLGDIVTIQEQRVANISPTMNFAARASGGRGGAGGGMMAQDAVIEGGELEVRAQIVLTVAIK